MEHSKLETQQGAVGHGLVAAIFDGRPTWTKLVSWRGNLDKGQSAINCEMAAAFVMVYIMKHYVVGAMDIHDSPLTIIEAFLNDYNFRGA